jgi:hypothetical protein
MNLINTINVFIGKETKDTKDKKKDDKKVLISDRSIQTEQIHKEFVTEDGRQLLV